MVPINANVLSLLRARGQEIPFSEVDRGRPRIAQFDSEKYGAAVVEAWRVTDLRNRKYNLGQVYNFVIATTTEVGCSEDFFVGGWLSYIDKKGRVAGLITPVNDDDLRGVLRNLAKFERRDYRAYQEVQCFILYFLFLLVPYIVLCNLLIPSLVSYKNWVTHEVSLFAYAIVAAAGISGSAWILGKIHVWLRWSKYPVTKNIEAIMVDNA